MRVSHAAADQAQLVVGMNSIAFRKKIELDSAPGNTSDALINIFESKPVPIDLQPGLNTLYFETAFDTDNSIVIDDITVSSPKDIEKANPHHIATTLPEEDFSDLIRAVVETGRQAFIDTGFDFSPNLKPIISEPTPEPAIISNGAN